MFVNSLAVIAFFVNGKKFLSIFMCLERFVIEIILIVVAKLKVVLKLITLGFKFQECAAHSNKSDNSKLTLKRNLLIVITVKRETK